MKPPPLPLALEVVSKDDLDLCKNATFMLKVSPSDQDSAEYKFSMYHVNGTDNVHHPVVQGYLAGNLRTQPPGQPQRHDSPHQVCV
jgi:hypothetical protein